VRLVGVTTDELGVILDPLPFGAPVAIGYPLRAVGSTSASVVVDVLDRLEEVARMLLPCWLPDARHLDHSSLDRRAVRALARRLASTTEHFGPFIADVAEAALVGRPAAAGHPPDIRARGLARIIATAYGRDGVALVVSQVDELAAEDQRRAGVAFEWLANHGPIGVWLVGDTLRIVDRFRLVTVPVPDHLKDLGQRALTPGREPHVVEFPSVAGRPHPGSAAEQRLEAYLSRCEWASGREWNQLHQTHPLELPIRVDLMWRQCRCAVEIDGPDHLGILKYADDRRRDNTLALSGFTVLRFINSDVIDDPAKAAATIEKLLQLRRREGRALPCSTT
jgi:very-short-patch-repair endonuclease